MDDEDKIRAILVGVVLFFVTMFFVFWYPRMTPAQKAAFWEETIQAIGDAGDDD